MFRMLKLNPPNGWRAVAWELAIVTAGVLIALAVQQWADERSWRARAADALVALKKENKKNFIFAAEITAVAPCVQAQLDALADRVERTEGRLDPAEPIASSLGEVAYRRPTRPYYTLVWDSYVADGVASHLPPTTRQSVATAYISIIFLKRLVDLSSDTIDRTTILLRPLELNAQSKITLIQEIASERNRVSGSQLSAAQVMAKLQHAGLAPDDSLVIDQLNRSGTVEYCRAKRLPLADWRSLKNEELRYVESAI